MTALDQISVRAFGSEPADLELDFEYGSWPHLTTRVIANCVSSEDGRPLDLTSIWRLTVGMRIGLLLEIVDRWYRRDFCVTLRCLNPSCRKPSEIDLTAREVLDYASQTGGADFIDLNFEGRTVRLRRPTGEDQLAWQRALPDDPEDAVRLAISSMLPDGGDGWQGESLARLAEAADAVLAEEDPLVGFEVKAKCPHCEAECQPTVDWTQLAMARLREAQSSLIHTVHRLAGHYHWSEAEIFAVPAWRRRIYMNAIEGGQA